MALNFTDLKVESYRRSPQPFPLASPVKSVTADEKIESFRRYIEEELRRIENSISTLTIAAPQVAIKEPDQKLLGMVRYAKSPWDPLGTGNGWVYWNGSAWTAL